MNVFMDRDFIEVWGKGCSKQQLDALDAQGFIAFRATVQRGQPFDMIRRTMMGIR